MAHVDPVGNSPRDTFVGTQDSGTVETLILCQAYIILINNYSI